MHNRTTPRRRRGALAAAGVTLAALACAMIPTAAQAAAVTPFDPSTPVVFVGYNAPTTLATADLVAGAGYSLTTLRPADSISYNALGFNTADDFLYGWDNTNSALLKIDSLGGTDQLSNPFPGTMSFNQGTFGLGADEGTYFVRNTDEDTLYAIDVENGTYSAILLGAAVPNVSDIVYRDGYIWAYDGQTAGTRIFYRIDPSTGAVSSFDVSSLGLVAQPYGGQWIYGNGDYGMTGNTDGTVYKISIAGGSTATPTFSVVSTERGVPTGNNDAASVFGAPADLALTKSGDPVFIPGESYTYTITVTNNGAGASTGSTVTDVLPSGLVSPTTTTPGCGIVGGTLTCTIGALTVGASATVTVTGTAADDATAASLTNSATVRGNEADPNAANDAATFAPAAPIASIALVKSADVEQVTRVGEVITYSFAVTNTGNVAVSDASVAEGEFSGAGELGELECPADVFLEPDETIVCMAEYVVVAADLTGEAITNTATAAAVGPTGATVESEEAAAEVATVELVLSPEPVPTPPTSKPGTLANTGGSDLTWVALSALFAVVAGAGLTVVRRRRA